MAGPSRGQHAEAGFRARYRHRWLALEDEFIAPPSGPGPVLSDPAHPYLSFYKFPRNPNPAFRVADLSNPILQPWTREELRKGNERALSGKTVFTPKERCWPIGVPGFLLYPALPVYFLQSPKEVVIIWTQDHQVRHVYLDQPHSRRVAPSWFGESVGHYEGDTLVVDTIGITTRTHIDNYQTPHTEQLHVVERFRMIDGGKMLGSMSTSRIRAPSPRRGMRSSAIAASSRGR